MFRTRDFVLFLVTTAFLVLAITSTATRNANLNTSVDDIGRYFESSEEPSEYQATVPANQPDQRAEKLEEMRRKIAANRDLLITESVPEDDLVVDADGVPTDTESQVTIEGRFFDDSQCNPVTSYQGSWNPRAIQTKISEGAIVYYTEETVAMTVASTTGSTIEMIRVTELVETPQLQLPLRPVVSSVPHCVTSDVVGIATDGSLIRNNEYSVYSIFGEETLLGYALDGWPIYGSTKRPLDACGGSFDIEGDYAYYLGGDESRSSIVQCFISSPVSI